TPTYKAPPDEISACVTQAYRNHAYETLSYETQDNRISRHYNSVRKNKHN
ncbi:21035_t:CDS:1, partial [Gigaspora margarita]